jgi:DNA polymerase III sliding clamp (beta) subunit (PCNA family)
MVTLSRDAAIAAVDGPARAAARNRKTALGTVVVMVEGERVVFKTSWKDGACVDSAPATLAKPVKVPYLAEVDGNALQQIVRACDGPVELSCEGKAGEAVLVVRCATAEWRLRELVSPKTVPPAAPTEIAVLRESAERLGWLLSKVSGAESSDEAKAGMNGIHIDFVDVDVEARVVAAATDGTILATASISVSIGVSGRPSPTRLVPTEFVDDALRALKRHEQEVATLAFGHEEVEIRVGSYRRTARLLPGEFPDFGSVFRSVGDFREDPASRASATFLRSDFVQVAKALSTVKTDALRLATSDKEGITLQTEDGLRERAYRLSFPAEVNDQKSAGVNPRKLVEVLALAGERTAVVLGSPLTPLGFADLQPPEGCAWAALLAAVRID